MLCSCKVTVGSLLFDTYYYFSLDYIIVAKHDIEIIETRRNACHALRRMPSSTDRIFEMKWMRGNTNMQGDRNGRLNVC